jgi:pimeloyl-ACP methyl ester carboxylesterase
MRALRNAPRTGMYRAMRAVMLNRPDITDVLSTIDAPTLVIAARTDPMLNAEQARTAAARMPHAAYVELGADGHIAPILAAADELADVIREFWKDPSARVER